MQMDHEERTKMSEMYGAIGLIIIFICAPVGGYFTHGIVGAVSGFMFDGVVLLIISWIINPHT